MQDELDRLRAAMELAERCHLEQSTRLKAEIDRLRAEVHEANAACDAQVRECNRLRAELKARIGMTDLDADFCRDKAVIIAERDRLRADNTGLRSQIAEIRRVVDSWRQSKETEG